MATVYEVVGYDGADPETYFFARSPDAHAKAREMRGLGYSGVTITPQPIKPNAHGIADAMQGLLDRFCVNEH
jgi:hypothetical protein